MVHTACQCYSGDHNKKRKVCWYVVCVWGWGISWFLVEELEGTNNLKVLVIDGRIILNGSARYGSSLDWDNLSLDGDLCQAVVKTIVNHWVA